MLVKIKKKIWAREAFSKYFGLESKNLVEKK